MKSLLANIAIFTAGISPGAHAADMSVKAPPVSPPPYNWSGPYLGAHLGGAWTSGSLPISGNNLYGGITEFIGGVQAWLQFPGVAIFRLVSRVILMGPLLVIPCFPLLHSAR